jgi:hypothetical protein
MQRTLVSVLLLSAFGAPAVAQDTVTPGTPPGWQFGGDTEKYEVGGRVPPRERAGTQVAYLRARRNAACGDYAALFQTIAADKYRGKRLKFSARLSSGSGMRGGRFNMFMFLGGPGHTSGVDRAQEPRVSAEDRAFSYNNSIAIGVPADAKEITFGFGVTGPRVGVSMDRVRLEVMGDYQPTPRSMPVSKASSVGTFESRFNNGLRLHGWCGYHHSSLIARGRYELDERSLTTMARRIAPQGVQDALSAQ